MYYKSGSNDLVATRRVFLYQVRNFPLLKSFSNTLLVESLEVSGDYSILKDCTSIEQLYNVGSCMVAA